MYMRLIGTMLILSGAIASAIALAQNPKATPNSERTQAAQVQEQTEEVARVNQRQGPPAQTVRPAQRRAPADVVTVSPYSVHPASPAYPAGAYPPPPSMTIRPYPVPTLSPEEQEQAQEFRDAVAQLRKAESDEDKKVARERLSEMISAQLDRDFEQREQKLAEIEARAKELREQLEHRRNTKSDIQKMLLMLIENPEAGLGLPPAWMNSVMSQPRGISADPLRLPQPASIPRADDPFGAAESVHGPGANPFGE